MEHVTHILIPMDIAYDANLDITKKVIKALKLQYPKITNKELSRILNISEAQICHHKRDMEKPEEFFKQRKEKYKESFKETPQNTKESFSLTSDTDVSKSNETSKLKDSLNISNKTLKNPLALSENKEETRKTKESFKETPQNTKESFSPNDSKPSREEKRKAWVHYQNLINGLKTYEEYEKNITELTKLKTESLLTQNQIETLRKMLSQKLQKLKN